MIFRMKIINLALFKIILLAAIFLMPQKVLTESNQIQNLLEQRIELLEEALRLARLRFQAGVGTSDDIDILIERIFFIYTNLG